MYKTLSSIPRPPATHTHLSSAKLLWKVRKPFQGYIFFKCIKTEVISTRTLAIIPEEDESMLFAVSPHLINSLNSTNFTQLWYIKHKKGAGSIDKWICTKIVCNCKRRDREQETWANLEHKRCSTRRKQYPMRNKYLTFVLELNDSVQRGQWRSLNTDNTEIKY